MSKRLNYKTIVNNSLGQQDIDTQKLYTFQKVIAGAFTHIKANNTLV
jgi:hypothetical protein